MSRLSYKTLILILLFLLIPIVLFLRINQKGKQVSAEWFNDSWNYRQRVDISNSSGSDLTDFQVSIDIGTSALIAAGKMQSDCDDIRITDQNGNLLPYWIEINGVNTCNQTSTKIWVKAPSLPASGAPVYFYYGNTSAASAQNGNDVFEFFDDFNDSSIDTTKWTVTGTMLSLTGGRIRAERANGTGSMYANSTYSRPFVLDMDFYPTQYPSGWEGTYHGTIAFGTFNTSNQNEHTWVPYGGGGNSYCGLCDDGGCYHGTYVNPLRVGDTLYNISMKIQPTIAGPQGVMSYTNTPNDSIGSSVSNTVYTAATTGDDPLKIGIKDYGGNTSDDFEWDNWRIRKYASTEPVATPASEEVGGGPIAHWKFDEGVGTSAFDSTSNQINGYFVGSTLPQWQTSDNCISDKCLKLTNSGEINFGNKFKPTTNPFTVSLWLKANSLSTPDAPEIFSKYQDLGHLIHLRVGYNNEVEFMVRGVGASIEVNTNNNSIEENKWYFLTAVYNPQGTTQIYLNGEANGTTSTANAGDLSNGNNSNVLIGRGFNAFRWNGLLDEVKIFPYARTADQIKADYASGLAGMSSSSDSSVNIGGASSGKALSDGLVGYWKFDEGVGTTTVDSSGNNNLATFGTGDSAPSWASGKYGIGVSFGGINYLEIGTTQNITNSITLAAWVKPTSGGVVIGKWSSHGLVVGPNYIKWVIWGKDWSTYPTITNNQWSHITAVYDYDKQLRSVYVNGVGVGETSTTGTLNVNSNPYSIGKWSTQEFFQGSLDEIRVYNRALSPTEVKQLYEYAPGPVGYWKFEEGVGTTAYDSSGNNNNARLYNGADFASGKHGKALRLNIGSTQNQYASFSQINHNYSFTKEAWIYPTSISGCGSENRCSVIAPYFEVLSNLQYYDNQLSPPGWHTRGTINLNQWQHIAVTYTNNSLNFFINGISVGSTTAYNNGSHYSNNIGAHSSNTRNFRGFIDEVKIYNYARTQKQILEDMAGSPPPGSSAKVSTPLVHYKFDEGFGSTVHNSGSIGSTLNGTFGTGTSSPSWAQGKFKKSLTFGGNDYVSTPDPGTNSALDMTDSLTLSAWINPSAIDTYRVILNKGNNYEIGALAGRLYFLYSNSGWKGWQATDISLTTGSWQHVTAVVTFPDNCTLYYNGKPLSIGYTWGTGVAVADSNPLTIGMRSGLSYPFSGLIDEVKIYNYALSADEVKQDYNQGSTFVFGTSNQTIGTSTTSLDYCVPGDTTYCAPPVAEWKFEEGVGTTAYDSSGNNNDGTLINSPTWTTGKIGKGLSLNGTNSYVNIPSLTWTPTQFTVGFWLKPKTCTSYNQALLAGSGWGQFAFHTTNACEVYVGTDVTNRFTPTNLPANTVTLNQWQYFVFTFDNNAGKFYKNGILLASKTGMSNPTTWGGFSIGSNASNTINGSIDQVRIYNYARTPAQIAYDYNQGAPVGHWKLDECQGTTIHDSSGNGNHGTLSIGASGTQTSPGTCTTSSTAWANGKLGKLNASLNFDGSDDYVNALNLPRSPNGTISAWIKPTSSMVSPTGYPNIARFVSDPGLYIQQGTGKPYIQALSGQSTVSSQAIVADTWQHIVGIYEQNGANTNLKIYFNGKLTGSISATGNIPQDLQNFGLSAATKFSGQIDDVRIYNYALTATQVKTLYNNGSVNFR